MNPVLRAENVSMTYAGKAILRSVNLQVSAGEFVSVIGPSGCGKSTLLSLLSGLTLPTEGQVFFKGERVAGPSRRRALIFQSYALFPWLTARENVRFVVDENDDERVDFFLDQVGLREFADFYPHKLSGGMQQRVGIARALAADPDVLLLDEPFASLDMIHRQILSQELLRLARKFNKAMVFVTHNVDEAIHLGDRIYLLSAAPATVVRELHVRGEKPDKILDFRRMDEFLNLERAVHEHLYQSSL